MSYQFITSAKLPTRHGEFDIHIFENVIPMSVRAAEMPAAGVSIYTHDGKGKVAKAYEQLVEEVVSHE